MKLVEILARELNEWPETKEYARQDYDMEICFSRGSVSDDTTTKFDFMPSRFASDNGLDSDQACGTLYVTRAQWEAERARIAQEEDDRMLAKHKAGADELERRHAEAVREAEDWSNECQKQYEQELWDKVASEIFIRACDESIATYRKEEVDYVAVRASSYADAFMAERAKRLKK